MGDWRHMHGAAFIGTGLRRNTVLRGSESIAYSASTAFNVILLRAAPISSGGWKIAAWRKRTTSRFDRFGGETPNLHLHLILSFTSQTRVLS